MLDLWPMIFIFRRSDPGHRLPCPARPCRPTGILPSLDTSRGLPPFSSPSHGEVYESPGVESITVDPHEDHLKAVDGQPGVGVDGPDRVARPGDGRRFLSQQPSLPLTIDQLFSHAIDRLDRADLGASEPHDVTDARSDKHAPRRRDVVESVAVSPPKRGGQIDQTVRKLAPGRVRAGWQRLRSPQLGSCLRPRIAIARHGSGRRSVPRCRRLPRCRVPRHRRRRRRRAKAQAALEQRFDFRHVVGSHRLERGVACAQLHHG